MNEEEKPEERREGKPEIKEEKKEEKPKQELEKKIEKEEKPKKPKLSGSEWYDKNYKKLLLISIIILIACFAYVGFFYAQHGDIMFKDVTLTGGTVITIYTEEEIDLQNMENTLASKLEDINVRKLEDITTRKQIGIVVETKSDSETATSSLEEFLGYQLDSSNSSLEISGASLSESFYKQMIIALAIAFVIMGLVVFIIFRKIVPSLAVILAAVMDIVGALTIANLFGFHISTAGIAAFLMLVGYSVDTDVMLTTKLIKRRGEGELNNRIKSAARTGLTMTITSLIAVLIGFFVAQSSVLKQIFFILSAGLFIDLISTWLGNASILKWWCKKKNIS
ncbi:MAG: protein translocase subunit SecF [Candidatus Pacearchaeota archaeon]|nr:MAG: protein translocase subunit SecF [Candidatus Pacearchaeota archaeon]